MTTSTMNKLFDNIDTLEGEIKKRFPKQKGRVILANIKTEIDYEMGKPSNDIEQLKWCRLYVDKLRDNLK